MGTSNSRSRDRSARPAGATDARLRADASRNREQILAAAQELFSQHGLDVALEDIAHVAGVGIATLYRRFPNREELVAAMYERRISAYLEAVERAAAEPDPWAGFCLLITDLCAMQARDAALKDLLTMTFADDSPVEQLKAQAVGKVEALVERAQRQGTLRPDFVVGDITLLLLANAGLVGATREHAADAWQRFAAYMIDAFAVQRVGTLPAPATYQQLSRAKLASRL